MNQSMGYIFCDGACSGNGTARAVAGWAWAYWAGHVMGTPSRHGSGHLAPPATNQRAELMALLEALRSWSTLNGGPVTIMTDSMYAINCTTKWGPGWARKGWRRDSGEPLQNLDLIKPLVAMWRPLWRLEHVRGHQTGGGWQAYGNNWVDRAAVVAAGGGGGPAVQHVAQPRPTVVLPPITDTPVFDPDEFLPVPTRRHSDGTEEAPTSFGTPQFIDAAAAIVVEEPVAGNVIEHVPAAAAAVAASKPATARRVHGLSKPVFQTDIATWFTQG